MDIAKYIGLYLLKNKFVYIHGLGNLALKKRPAAYQEGVLEAPSWEVELSQHGSIDDNFANFIATNEQVSISKASNTLREFSTMARSELQSGKDVVIPSVGKFVQSESGQISFITDPHLEAQPPAVPVAKIATRQEPPQKEKKQKNQAVYTTQKTEEAGTDWTKVTLWVVGVLAVGVLGYFGWKYMNDQSAGAEEAVTIMTPQDTAVTIIEPPFIDTLGSAQDTTNINSPVKEVNGLLSFDVILNTYTDIHKAEKRLKQLQSFGNQVALVSTSDSTTYYVILPVKDIAASDTTKFLDSVRKQFNPDGVSILGR